MQTVSVDEDHHLAYTEYGDPDGDPAVFFHGTPGSRKLGALFDTAAQESGVRLLAFDRPGYGYSSPWPTRTVRDAGAYVSTLLDDANIQTAPLIAFSGGSAHALATAATHPHRIDRVDSIAGVVPPRVRDSTPMVQRLLAGLATTTPTLLRGLFRGQAWLAARLDPSFVVAQYTADSIEDPIPDTVAEVVKADFIEAFAQSQSGAVTEFHNTATDWDISLDAIDVDVSLWHGDADTNVPIAGARRLEAHLPRADLQVLDGADHLRTLLRSMRDVLTAAQDYGRPTGSSVDR
ncbi:alpha/beta fold hydrolase [Halospeciosus flavus]|uniref:Alpha/beta fold hydrolase n=1 Tax=Halospeciosus flavus TaxID=3032283 RepID=A0ABD5Z3E5_9EURY|nr:alpha/beta hydrolase [Halospeciosus flavus]